MTPGNFIRFSSVHESLVHPHNSHGSIKHTFVKRTDLVAVRFDRLQAMQPIIVRVDNRPLLIGHYPITSKCEITNRLAFELAFGPAAYNSFQYFQVQIFMQRIQKNFALIGKIETFFSRGGNESVWSLFLSGENAYWKNARRKRRQNLANRVAPPCARFRAFNRTRIRRQTCGIGDIPSPHSFFAFRNRRSWSGDIE